MISEVDLSCWDVSRETCEALCWYEQELLKWQKSINLVGPDTVHEVWSRHVIDSLQLLPLLSGRNRIADFGSGAGFPGLALAIALRDQPGSSVTLVESNAKKAAFLRHVGIATRAPVQIVQQRIEAVVKSLTADVVTARALAPLAQLIRWLEPLLKNGAMGLFHKGRDLEMELEEAARYWDIGHSIIPSVVAPQSYILKIDSIRARNGGAGN